MAELLEIDDDNFMSQVMDSQLPVLVDCWASWCGPCKMMGPELEALADEQAGRLNVVKLDTEAHPGLAGLLGVTILPTMVLFVDGIAETSVVGYQPKGEVLGQIESFLKSVSTKH